MRSWILGGALVLLLAAAVAVHIPDSQYWGPPGPWGASSNYGYGMGPWMMGRYGMGPWMIGPGITGYGYGPGAIARGWGNPAGNLNLSLNDVKSYLERSVALSGNSHLKVGDVTEKDVDTITADIVTTDKDGLVQRFTVNRHSGVFQPEGG